jgi:reverse gyrase
MILRNSEKRPCKNCNFFLTYNELNANGLCTKCQNARDLKIIHKILLEESKQSNELTEVEKVALEARDFLLEFANYLKEKGDSKFINILQKKYSKTLLQKYINSGMKKKSNK